ncbi:hypothetical protein ACFFX0_29395 [Citricoccus parietis]|uniref:Uncharacterized protein n=1 Tax=Citricoccus parietis TaxID=592307 RepID=A0ABV5G7Y5_9MICC
MAGNGPCNRDPCPRRRRARSKRRSCSQIPSGAPKWGSVDSFLSVASAIIFCTLVHGQASP